MNAESNSGKEPETRTPPTGEAGCETEIDRNVLGTVHRTGFAELRARCLKYKQEAERVANFSAQKHLKHCVANFEGMAAAFAMVLQDIDALSGCEECMEEEVGD